MIRAPVFPGDEIADCLRQFLREHIAVVAVTVRIGRLAQQHAVFGIIEVEFLLGVRLIT